MLDAFDVVKLGHAGRGRPPAGAAGDRGASGSEGGSLYGIRTILRAAAPST